MYVIFISTMQKVKLRLETFKYHIFWKLPLRKDYYNSDFKKVSIPNLLDNKNVLKKIMLILTKIG